MKNGEINDAQKLYKHLKDISGPSSDRVVLAMLNASYRRRKVRDAMVRCDLISPKHWFTKVSFSYYSEHLLLNAVCEHITWFVVVALFLQVFSFLSTYKCDVRYKRSLLDHAAIFDVTLNGLSLFKKIDELLDLSKYIEKEKPEKSSRLDYAIVTTYAISFIIDPIVMLEC